MALIVATPSLSGTLSPFFARAPWLLIVDADGGDAVAVENRGRTRSWMAAEIVRHGADKVICGHAPPYALRVLHRSGVDVRLGPCSVPVVTLVAGFETLPKPSAPDGDTSAP